MASWHRKQDIPAYEIAELIVSGIIPIVLIVVGTIGNFTCIAILLNKQNREASTNIYLIFLCLVDTISLYQWNLKHIFYTMTDGQRRVFGNSIVLCKLSLFFGFYTLHTSAMFLTFVQLDRAFLLRSRWYKAKVARPRIALIICIIILVTLFGLNGFLFGLGHEYSHYHNGTATWHTRIACYYSLNAELNHFFSTQFTWIHLVVMYIVPFSVSFICTLLIVKKLIVKQTFTNNQLAINAQRNRRISVMLLLMCFTYVITTLPNRLCFSVFEKRLIGHDYSDTVFLATNTLMYTRNALNAFFLYLSVNGFRRDFRRLVLICWAKLTGRDVPRGNNTTENAIGMRAGPEPIKTAANTIPIKKTTQL